MPKGKKDDGKQICPYYGKQIKCIHSKKLF